MSTPALLDAGSVEWHRARVDGIGASESAALFGLSPYGGPLDVYLAKTTPPEELAARPDSDVMRRGRKLEGYLADEAADRFGWTLETVGVQRHPAHPFLTASPDRLVLDEAGNVAALVEIKTARNRQGWTDPKEDPSGCPEHYLIQVQHQLAVGVEWRGVHVWPTRAYLVASVGSLDDFRCYAIDAHAGMGARIIEVCGAFWRDHVVPRVPPAFDGSAGGDAVLRAMFPIDVRPVLVEASTASAEDAAALRAARAELSLAEKREAELVQRLKAAIGDGAGLQGPGFRMTWKAAKGSDKTDWPKVAEGLRLLLAAEVGEHEAQAAAREIITKNTTTQPGVRRFVATFTD